MPWVSSVREDWAEALARRGEYPSRAQAAGAVRVRQRITDEIDAGNDAGAQRAARSHLAAPSRCCWRSSATGP